ncbi:MAG: rhodanese-like protein [Pedosphaera sp.]|nr:rhodanese-like protein [Pedosphaera sp.]
MNHMKSIRIYLTLAGLATLLTFATTRVSQADPTNPPAAQAPKPSTSQLIDVTEAEKLIASKKVVILDVRTPAEFADGHLAGATNLDFRDPEFQAKLAKLDKSQPYLVHCAIGGRSAKASKVMTKLDFKSVYDLKGGLEAWKKAEKPVEK